MEMHFLVYMYVCVFIHVCVHVCMFMHVSRDPEDSLKCCSLGIVHLFWDRISHWPESQQVVNWGLPISTFLALVLQASTTMPRPFFIYLKIIFIYYFNLFLLLYSIYFKIIFIILFIHYHLSMFL